MKSPARMTVNGRAFALFGNEAMQEEYENRHPSTAATIGQVSISLFRDKPDYDCIVIHHEAINDREWTMVFEQYELLTWMGAVALGKERQNILYHSERQNGSFREKYGWNCAVFIEDVPSAEEEEFYADFLAQNLNPDELLKET